MQCAGISDCVLLGLCIRGSSSVVKLIGGRVAIRLVLSKDGTLQNLGIRGVDGHTMIRKDYNLVTLKVILGRTSASMS